MSDDSKITHHIFAGLQGDLLVCPKNYYYKYFPVSVCTTLVCSLFKKNN